MKRFFAILLTSASLVGMQRDKRMDLETLLNPLPKTTTQPTAAADSMQTGAVQIVARYTSKYPSYIDDNGQRIYVCPHSGCAHTATNTHNIARHQLIHSTEKPFKCHYARCNFATKHKRYLKTHILKHTGKKPYQCLVCNQTFRIPESAKNHVCTDHHIDWRDTCYYLEFKKSTNIDSTSPTFNAEIL